MRFCSRFCLFLLFVYFFVKLPPHFVVVVVVVVVPVVCKYKGIVLCFNRLLFISQN